MLKPILRYLQLAVEGRENNSIAVDFGAQSFSGIDDKIIAEPEAIILHDP